MLCVVPLEQRAKDNLHRKSPRAGNNGPRAENARTLLIFSKIRASFRTFDTVTLNNARACKEIGELIGSCYIDVTGVVVSAKAELHAAVERLVASHALHGSESLCKLLRYLAKRAQEQPGVQVKEYQIATEVFGRQADFDPQLDSFVRVQAGRLRTKLAEYYGSEGSADRLVVELPKGSYALALHERPALAGGNGVGAEKSVALGTVPSPGARPLVLVLSAALIASLLFIAWFVASRRDPNAVQRGGVPPPAVFGVFWDGFSRKDQEPWVIFSNAAFVGRPDTGMRYYDAARDQNAQILDHYTGVGEVLAVHNLDLLFRTLQRSVRVKRGSLFSLDDAKNNDLIFIGSPSENLTLLEVPSTTEFLFRRIDKGVRAGNVSITNAHPQGNEAPEFLATPSNVPLTEDYAVVALEKGLNPQHFELILAGTTTLGTQAAVEYVTTENYLNDLLHRLNVSKAGELKPFEAVIHVKVARGVPVESSIVALHLPKS